MRTNEREKAVIRYLLQIFPGEVTAGGFRDDIVALDKTDRALVTAWLGAVEIADVFAPQGTAVDRAFLGALAMMQFIHDNDDIASAVMHYPPLDVWKKFIGNVLLTTARGQDDFIMEDKGITPPPLPPDSEYDRYSENAIKSFLIDIALLTARTVVKEREIWGNKLIPMVAAVILCEMCRMYPGIYHLARRAPALEVVKDAIYNFALDAYSKLKR